MEGRLKELNEMQLKLTLHLSLSSGAIARAVDLIANEINLAETFTTVYG